MTDEEIEHHAQELQRQPFKGPGRVFPWDALIETSREYWREKVRKGERAPEAKEPPPW